MSMPVSGGWVAARRVAGRAAGMVIVAFGGVALTGCSLLGGGGACPAIGFTSVVPVVLVGDVEAVKTVVLCNSDGECSQDARESERGSSQYRAEPDGGARWSITSFGGALPEASVTAYRADGSVAGETTTPLAWVRVGGTEECGGPTESFPVVVAAS